MFRNKYCRFSLSTPWDITSAPLRPDFEVNVWSWDFNQDIIFRNDGKVMYVRKSKKERMVDARVEVASIEALEEMKKVWPN